jgi:hypothetical protein
MNNYILRLDDASDYMDLEKWTRVESLVDKYGIKPIFGIIPGYSLFMVGRNQSSIHK